MENNKNVNTRLRKLSNLKLREEIFSILANEEKNKISNIFRVLKRRFPFRLADSIIIFGMIAISGYFYAILKNFNLEAYRTSEPYKTYFALWGFFPWTYERQPRDPFIYSPNPLQARDSEKYQNYKEEKKKLTFKRQQEYDLIIRSTSMRCPPFLDHRELDFSRYQNFQRINYDMTALNRLVKSLNEEVISIGIPMDPKLYIKENLNYQYKISDYIYKDDLYSELKRLLEI